MKNIFFLAAFFLLASCGEKKKLFTPKKQSTEVGIKSINTVMTLDSSVLAQLVANHAENLSLEVPYKGNVIDLELTQVDLFTEDFKLRTDKGDIEYSPGLFYSGKVKGDANSLVSISLFNNDVNGVISSPELGDLNLGKIEDVSAEYIMYSADDVDEIPFLCKEPVTTPELDSLRAQAERNVFDVGLKANTCVTIDFELTNEIYNNFGGNVANATNWFTSAFAGVKAICANEGINVNIKSIFLWSTDDGYSDSPDQALTQVQAKRNGDPNFTGMFVHLVRGQSSNLSGIAYIATACVNSYRYGFSAVLYNYAAYPAFSWTIEVLTHELGHNMGSPHTHSCSWVGGPIDNCYTQEGNCVPGPRPGAGQGTIMSYCHLVSTVGIRFSNGFGPQPGNLIRSRIGAATCVSCVVNPPPVPTCTDGIKNGNETGVDCGGTCPPCPVLPTCTDGIKNGTETGIDCGGNCKPCSVSDNLALNKTATQSTIYPSSTQYPANYANDGDVSTFSHTDQEPNPWLQIDLGQPLVLNKLSIAHRIVCCGYRLREFKIFVTNTEVTSYNTPGEVYKYVNGSGVIPGSEVVIPVNVIGRYIKLYVQNLSAGDFLHIGELRAFGPGTPIRCDTFKLANPVTYRDSVVCK